MLIWFGIFTENGFFKGGINATTGSFTGVVHINTSASEIMKLGTNVDSTNDGIHINNNNYWYTDSQFKGKIQTVLFFTMVAVI